jgi:gliding motility-associated lipoprotein GldH
MTHFQTFPSIAFLLLLVFGFTACGDNFSYKSEKKISNGQWAYADTLDYKVPVSDTAQLYNLYIQFTHSDTFSTQNIYLKLHTRFPDGKRVSRIRSFDLYDMEGKPAGKCSGSSCQTRMMLQNNLYFNQIGEFTITLEQYTRSNPLSGVTAVGIMMEKAAKKR